MENGQVLHSSLYVEQIDKFAVSLKQLAKTFLKLEEKKQTFSEEEIDEMFACVREEVCEKCEKNSWCWGKLYSDVSDGIRDSCISGSVWK